MAWIESHEELPSHPKTRKLARKLNVSIPAAIGHLHVLWYWCLTHRPDGRLEGLDVDDVADAAGWEGEGEAFTASLIAAGWLDEEDGALSVHDWWEGAGKTIKRRKFATSRQRRARDTEPSEGDVTDDTDAGNADVTRDMRLVHTADSDSDSDSEPKSKRAKRSSEHPLPNDWNPTGTHRELAQRLGRDLAFEAEQFRDHAEANDRRQRNWDAAFRTWLRNGAKWARQSPTGRGEDVRGDGLVL